VLLAGAGEPAGNSFVADQRGERNNRKTERGILFMIFVNALSRNFVFVGEDAVWANGERW